MSRGAAVLGLVLAGACTMSDDPGEGGFYSGIAGLAGGGYDARIAEREAGVAAETDRRDALQDELARLRGEHDTLATRIRAARARAAAQGTPIPPSIDLQAQAALAPPPTDLASLRASIEEARAVAEQLETLSS